MADGRGVHVGLRADEDAGERRARRGGDVGGTGELRGVGRSDLRLAEDADELDLRAEAQVAILIAIARLAQACAGVGATGWGMEVGGMCGAAKGTRTRDRTCDELREWDEKARVATLYVEPCHVMRCYVEACHVM